MIFFKPNELACQENCHYSNYSIESNYLKCECDIVEQNEIEIDKPKKFTAKIVVNSFINVFKYSNYKVLKCIGLVFRKNIIYENYGSILTIIYFFGFLSGFIMYCIKGLSYLKYEFQKNYINKIGEKIKNDIKNINNNNIIVFHKDSTSSVINKKSKIEINSNKNKKEKISLNLNKQISGSKNLYFNHNIININKKRLKGNLPPKKQYVLRKPKKRNNQRIKVKLLFEDYIKEYILQEKKEFFNKKGIEPSSKQILKELNQNGDIKKEGISENLTLFSSNKKNEEINKDFDDYELNSMEYLSALEKDKRNFLRVYWSLLKREHLIIFTFFSWNDYNLFSIKFSKLFYLINTDMVLNMFFFSDESMHNIYKSGGKYDFIGQIFQMIISTLISQLLQIFLNYLTMTDILYYEIKSLNYNINKEKVLNIINCIKYKIVFFYLFVFILYLFYWYIISAFCAVYVNTQKIFITNSLLSFFIGLLYPFALYFIPTGLRFLSLKANSRKNLNFIYCVSNIIPFF